MIIFFLEMDMDIDDDDAILVKALDEHEQRALGYHDIKYDTFHMSFKTPQNSCFIYAPLMGLFSHMGFRNFILELLFKEKQEINSLQLVFLKQVTMLVYGLLSDHREDMDAVCDKFLEIIPRSFEGMENRNASEFLGAFLLAMERQLSRLQRSHYYLAKFNSMLGLTVATRFLCNSEKHYTEQRSDFMKLRVNIEPGLTIQEILKKHFSLRSTDECEGDLFCTTCNKQTSGHRQRVIYKAPSTLMLELIRENNKV